MCLLCNVLVSFVRFFIPLAGIMCIASGGESAFRGTFNNAVSSCPDSSTRLKYPLMYPCLWSTQAARISPLAGKSCSLIVSYHSRVSIATKLFTSAHRAAREPSAASRRLRARTLRRSCRRPCWRSQRFHFVLVLRLLICYSKKCRGR
jgi:hypothetical protein